MVREWLTPFGIVALLFVAGCASTSDDRIPPVLPQPIGVQSPHTPFRDAALEGPVLPFEAIVTQHNSRIARLRSLWCRARVECTLQRADGTIRESGDGYIAFQPPARISVAFLKFDEPQLIIGADSSRYWCIDFVSATAAIGRNENIDRADTAPLPFGLHPLDLPFLMGYFVIGADATQVASQLSQVQLASGQVEHLLQLNIPLGRYTAIASFDPQSSLLRALEIRRGSTVVAFSALGDYRAVDESDASGLPGPMLPTQLLLVGLTPPSQLRLSLRHPELAPSGTRELNPSLFDFSGWCSHAPISRYIVLDALSPRPALTTEQLNSLIEEPRRTR